MGHRAYGADLRAAGLSVGQADKDMGCSHLLLLGISRFPGRQAELWPRKGSVDLRFYVELWTRRWSTKGILK